MKSKFVSFLSGVLVTVMALGLSVTAFAASNSRSITVYPINILVDGQQFQPKDAKGNTVEVFTYNGTTYAPLRALAEAYGLEVGYDSAKHIATVNKTSTQGQAPATVTDTSYAAFERQWTVKEKPVTNYGNEKIYTATYSGTLSMSEFKTWWKSYDLDTIKMYTEQLAAEAQSMNPGYTVTMYFSYGQYNLGTAYAESTYTGSNFDAAKVWIK